MFIATRAAMTAKLRRSGMNWSSPGHFQWSASVKIPTHLPISAKPTSWPSPRVGLSRVVLFSLFQFFSVCFLESSILHFPTPSDINLPTFTKVCSAAVNGIEAYRIEVADNAGFGDTVIAIVANKTPDALIFE